MANIKETTMEVIYAILPITIVVIILQFTLIGMPWETFIQFLIGVVMVGFGFFLFTLGVHIGLLPLGERVGSVLPKSGKAWVVIFFGFILGLVVTVAEPDVRILAGQIDTVSDGNISKNLLIYTVALGVGIFVALAMLRIIFNISLTWLLLGGYALVFLIAIFAPQQFVPISLDSGGVTTGPMTVPFILSLGVGVTSVMRGKSSSGDGFGLVALASLGPVLSVLLLGVIYG